jgi:hypothetical protein
MSSAKKLTSQSPNVTVVVGSGDDAREFECYGVILASASPVLDAMLSSGMKERENKRIEFPDKRPEEWEMVLRCIDTETALLFQTDHPFIFRGEYQYEYDERDDGIIKDLATVKTLVPWFHELQMNAYLSRCDMVLDKSARSKKARWTRAGSRELIDLFLLSTKYDLYRTKVKTEREVARIIEQFCWRFGELELFDLSTVRQIVEVLLPIRLVETSEERSTKKQRCGVLQRDNLD